MSNEKTGSKKKLVLNKRGRRLVFAIIALLVIAIVLVLLNLKPAGAGDKIKEEWKTPSYLRDKTINILVCGVDTDVDRSESPDAQESDATLNTDVIMLVSIDRETNKATIFQIPRDTYVGEDLVKYGKINGLYGRGYSDGHDPIYKEKNPGMACLIETINYQFKLPVDNYVLITMEGFRKAVDMLGGVEVTLDQTLDFKLYESDGKTVKENISLEPGTHLLDGISADMFVRYRDAEGDIGRMNVQRYFLAALMNKALNTSTKDLASLAVAIYPYLETDFSVSELLALVDEAKAMSSESISTVRVPGENVSRYGIWGVDVWSVHNEELAALLNEYMRPYTDDVSETELNTVEIRNTKDDVDSQASLDKYKGD